MENNLPGKLKTFGQSFWLDQIRKDLVAGSGIGIAILILFMLILKERL